MSDLVTVDLESFCGFCGCRVGAGLEERRKHMFGCRKHPAYDIGKRYQEIAEVVAASGKEGAAWSLLMIERILSRP